MKIISFTCQPGKIFIFYDGCGKEPRQPYFSHPTIEAAEKMWKYDLGCKNVELIRFYPLKNGKNINWEVEFKKCIDSPYYFWKNYCIYENKPEFTEADFNIIMQTNNLL